MGWPKNTTCASTFYGQLATINVFIYYQKDTTASQIHSTAQLSQNGQMACEFLWLWFGSWSKRGQQQSKANRNSSAIVNWSENITHGSENRWQSASHAHLYIVLTTLTNNNNNTQTADIYTCSGPFKMPKSIHIMRECAKMATKFALPKYSAVRKMFARQNRLFVHLGGRRSLSTNWCDEASRRHMHQMLSS